MTEQPEQQPGEAEQARIESLDERFGRIEAEQAEHRTLLEQIRDGITGARTAEDKAHGKAEQHTQDRLAHPPAETMADQVRKAVEAVNAEAEQKRRDEQHAADHQALREAAEKPPREAMSGFRGKLTRVMYGGDPR